jgi:hypothetical protein
MYDFLKKTLSILYFCLMKIIKPDIKFIGSIDLVKQKKTCDTIYILATGSSINDFSSKDLQTISEADSIGVNFFIFHSLMPTIYLIEPYITKLGYFEILKRKKYKNATVLYKGYASPKKFFIVLKDILSIPKEINNFLIAKDAYLKNNFKNSSLEQQRMVLDSSKSDFLYNDGSSLLYAIYMSYKMGYKSIVLCGFDMSDKYFYCKDKEMRNFTDKYNLCQKERVNTIYNNKDRKFNINNTLVHMNKILQLERSGGLFVHYKSPKLSEFLPVFKNID